MKTTLAAGVVILLTSVFTFGQGKIVYQNTTAAGKQKYIYGLDTSDPLSAVLGGTRERCAGTRYSVQLWWSLSGNDLKPVDGSLTHFKTGSAAGLIDGNSNLILQGALGGTKVVLQLRVWNNGGGAVKTWEDVLSDGSVARGQSQLIRNYELQGVDADNIPHVGSGNLAAAGLQSFGLYLIPEPSTIGIVVLGLAALASHIFTAAPGASFVRYRSPTKWGRGRDDKNRSGKKIRHDPKMTEGTGSFSDHSASNISVATPPFPVSFAPSRLRVRHAPALLAPAARSMKKILRAAFVVLLTGAAAPAFGQGKIGMQNTDYIGKERYVYGLDPTNPLSEVLGGRREKLDGSGYSAQVWWGLSGTPVDELKPVEGSLTFFRSGVGAGLMQTRSNVVVEGALGGTRVVLQIRVWDKRGGTIESWADVLRDGTVARGESSLILDYELSGLGADNVPHVGSGSLVTPGMRTFGLYLVPEPSTIGLVVLGLGTLIHRRRR